MGVCDINNTSLRRMWTNMELEFYDNFIILYLDKLGGVGLEIVDLFTGKFISRKTSLIH